MDVVNLSLSLSPLEEWKEFDSYLAVNRAERMGTAFLCHQHGQL